MSETYTKNKLNSFGFDLTLQIDFDRIYVECNLQTNSNELFFIVELE